MIRPIEILIRVKDEATSMLTSVQAKVTAVAAAVAAFFGITLFAGAVKSAGEFEAALSRVKAATDASVKEMAALKQAAEDAGANTKYTSVQAANALENLAKAGLDAEKAIAALPAVLSLAQAGDIELAQASEMVTKAVMGMGLSFDQAGRVADVLAMGANASNTSVKGLAEALSYAAPVAHSLGLSLEGTVAIIGKFADAGIDASRAGTALNSILSQFSDPASKFRTELGAAGIVTTNFERALAQLAAAGPKGQKAILAVGQEAGPALRALLNQGMGALDELKAKLLDSAGSAARTAAVMEDNLPGAMNSLASAWDTVKNVLGTPVLPVLKDAVNELAGSLKGIVSDGTVGKFGDAIAEAFRAGVKWARDFLAQVDFGVIIKSMQDFADRAQETFNQVADYAATAGNSVRLAYGVMSAGANTVLAGIYGLGVAFTETAAFIVRGSANMSEALSKIAIGSAKQRLLDEAAQMREALVGLSGVSDEFSKRASASMDAAARGAQVARDGFNGLASGTDAAAAASARADAAIQAVAASVVDAGQKTTAAAQASKDKAAADKAAADSVKQLQAEYSELVARGSIQEAAEKLQQINRVLLAAPAAADAAKEAAAQVEAAYTNLGLKTTKELTDAAEVTKRSWETLAASGVQSSTALRQGFEAYAKAAMEAAERQSDAAAKSTRSMLETQAASKGLKLSFDEAGKASVTLGDAVGKTSAALRSGTSAAAAHAGAVRDIGDAYTDAGAKALAAQGQFLAAAAAQRSADTSASSITKRPQSENQFAWTRLAIMDWLKQAGLDDDTARRISGEFVDSSGNVPYSNNAGQIKYGGRDSTMTQALYKAVEQYKFKGGGAASPSPSPAPAPAPAPSPGGGGGAGGNTYVNNIVINGLGDWGVVRATTRHVDAQSANAEIDVLRKLAQAQGASI